MKNPSPTQTQGKRKEIKLSEYYIDGLKSQPITKQDIELLKARFDLRKLNL
jgi:hypothetical protein